jgi:transposase
MAFIVGKKQDGKTYYYLSESARVDGKPRIVSQRYLGSAEEIMARLSEVGPGEPDHTRHLAFGDLAATWSVIRRLRIAEIVDEVLGPRRADASAAVGTYIALAILNRVLAPCSKLAFADWWATTAGDHLLRLGPGALDHRRFWDAMDAISPKQLVEIERRVVAGMVGSFGLDCSGLVLDMTNFATYIDSANDKAPIAQRGHAKQKRTDLRLVGLGLVVATDGGIPLVSHAYAGNHPDVSQFPLMIRELAKRFGALAGLDTELTLVYDAGQDSEANQDKVASTQLHFVGSLPPAGHPELLARPKADYSVVDEDTFAGLSAFETTKAVLGGEYRLVVTHSQNLHDKQCAGFAQTLAKATRSLGEVQARLARGRTRKSREALEAEIAEGHWVLWRLGLLDSNRVLVGL